MGPRTAVLLCALLLAVGGGRLARAGPPLVSDDPHVVGAGNVEAILAGGLVQRGDETGLQAPALDLTLGLLHGLDATFVVALAHVRPPDESPSNSATIIPGFKWQPIHGARLDASFSPAVAIDSLVSGELGFVLPVQVEYGWEHFGIGTDLGYTIVRDAPDQWQTTLYGLWSASDDLMLLAELWSLSSIGVDSADFGGSVGVEWALPRDFYVLAAVGTGFASTQGSRIDAYAYVGLMWAFEAFTPARRHVR